MNNIRTALNSPLALAAAITLAVAAVTAATMPETTPVPTAESPGDTTPGLHLTPAAHNSFCTSVGSLPGDPPQRNCRRIPVTVTAAYNTSAARVAR